MRAAKKLIEIRGKLRARDILAHGRKVRRGLAIQQAEFLQFAMIEGRNAARPRPADEILEP
jgi:hypothetical protein